MVKRPPVEQLMKDRRLRDHTKVRGDLTNTDLETVAQVAFRHGIDKTLPILNHPKTTRDNLWAVAGVVSKCGLDETHQLLNHPKTTPDNLGNVAYAVYGQGLDKMRPLLDHPKTTHDNLWTVAQTVSKCGLEETNQLLNHPKTTPDNLDSVAWAASKRGLHEIHPLLDHDKTTPGNLGDVAWAVYNKGINNMRPLLNHSKTTAANLGPVASAAAESNLDAVHQLLNHRRTTAANLAAVATVAARHGVEATLSAWGHPKTTLNNLKPVAWASYKYGIKNMRPLLDHPRTTSDNLAAVAQAALKHNVEPTLAALGHPRTTPNNLLAVAHAVSKRGINIIRPLLDNPAVTPDNLSAVAEAAAKYGVEPTLVALGYEKTTPDNLPAVAEAVAKYGVKPTLAALGHPRTTPNNLLAVAEAASQHGIRQTLAAWGHPRTTPHNLREVAKTAKEHRVKRTLGLWDNPHVTHHDLNFIAGIVKIRKIPDERLSKLLSYDWRDVVNGKIDFQKLKPEERAVVAAKLTKASSPDNRYKYRFLEFLNVLKAHRKIDHMPTFTMDDRINVTVRTGEERKIDKSAFKLATHFAPKSFPVQLAYALPLLGHKDEFLAELRGGNDTADNRRKLDALLRRERLGSLGNPEETVKTLLRKKADPGLMLATIPEIARQRGFNLEDFNPEEHSDKTFDTMKAFFEDALPHYASEAGLRPDFISATDRFKDRFKVKLRGRRERRRVRLVAMRKTPLHSLYSLWGQTCIHQQDRNRHNGLNEAANDKFSPVVMFDDKTGELLGTVVLCADKRNGRLHSYGFEPLNEFGEQVANPGEFVKRAYGAIATNAKRQQMKLVASGAFGQISNLDRYINVIEGIGKPIKLRTRVSFPQGHRIPTRWLDLSHLARAA